MGNLWAWGERIVRAARGEGEDVFGVDIRFPQLGTQLGREEDVGEDDEEDYGEGEGEEDENGDDREEGEVEISKEEEQELDQKVWKVMLSARDLTAWLLNEEAKREVEELWVNAWRCGDGREG